MTDTNDIFEEIKKAVAGKAGITIEIERNCDNGLQIAFSTDDRSAIDEMSKEELLQYRSVLEEKIADLDAEEPVEGSPELEEWEELHEELEDLLDEVEDRLDDLT